MELRAEADAALAEMKAINGAREAKIAALADQLRDLRIDLVALRGDVGELRAIERGGKLGDLLLPAIRRDQIN